jgi:hypothetical protein
MSQFKKKSTLTVSALFPTVSIFLAVSACAKVSENKVAGSGEYATATGVSLVKLVPFDGSKIKVSDLFVTQLAGKKLSHTQVEFKVSQQASMTKIEVCYTPKGSSVAGSGNVSGDFSGNKEICEEPRTSAQSRITLRPYPSGQIKVTVSGCADVIHSITGNIVCGETISKTVNFAQNLDSDVSDLFFRRDALNAILKEEAEEVSLIAKRFSKELEDCEARKKGSERLQKRRAAFNTILNVGQGIIQKSFEFANGTIPLTPENVLSSADEIAGTHIGKTVQAIKQAGVAVGQFVGCAKKIEGACQAAADVIPAAPLQLTASADASGTPALEAVAENFVAGKLIGAIPEIGNSLFEIMNVKKDTVLKECKAQGMKDEELDKLKENISKTQEEMKTINEKITALLGAKP